MLYLVATPIGNLNDITLRALETLRTVDIVASEDTRKTGLLLKHFDISKPQISFHEHNEDHASDRILALLSEGKSVAIVTDAGTPGIADPGFVVVRKAIAAQHEFTMIPGPTGLIMALVLSGLAVHSFTFRGFPPRKSGPRKRFFEVDKLAPHTLLFYESPFRIEACLRDALDIYGDRNAALANDLTKKFEQVQRAPLSVLLKSVQGKTLKGEFILVIAGIERANRIDRMGLPSRPFSDSEATSSRVDQAHEENGENEEDEENENDGEADDVGAVDEWEDESADDGN